MNVLSLFDGMSCGQLALERAGIKVNKYYASELDKFAVKESTGNFPNMIHLGDVTKWREWDIDWASIDLLIGGSPCQGFSFAGKQLAFDDPRSALFFVYVDILNHIKSLNPDVKFLLENVKMKKEHMAVINEYLGVEPVFINSALVSAQNRQRYYWANWEFDQPEDKGIMLVDIIEHDADIALWGHTDKAIDYMNRKVKDGRTHWDFKHHSDTADDKSQCVTANTYKGVPYNVLVVRPAAVVGRKINPETGKREDYNKNIPTVQTLEVQPGFKSRCLSTVSKDCLISDLDPGRYPRSKQCRKLTVVECCRLQTVPDDYFKVSSNTQAYKMLGNGWTVDVIAHIFKFM